METGCYVSIRWCKMALIHLTKPSHFFVTQCNCTRQTKASPVTLFFILGDSNSYMNRDEPTRVIGETASRNSLICQRFKQVYGFQTNVGLCHDLNAPYTYQKTSKHSTVLRLWYVVFLQVLEWFPGYFQLHLDLQAFCVRYTACFICFKSRSRITRLSRTICIAVFFHF